MEEELAEENKISKPGSNFGQGSLWALHSIPLGKA